MSTIAAMSSSLSAYSASSSMSMTDMAGTGEAGAMAGSAMTATSSVSMVSQNVSMMLGSIDSGLAGNETLKMAIAMLILQALLGEQDGSKSGGDMINALAGSMGGQSSAASMLMMSSSSTSISIEQSVSMSHAAQAYAGSSAMPVSSSMNTVA